MISQESIALASGITSSLAGRGAELGVKPNTPLSILNQGVDVISGAIKFEDDTAALKYAAEDHGTMHTSHSGDMDSIAAGMAERIAGNIAALRNKINPLIKAIYDASKARESEINSNSPININVIHVATPEVYDTESLDRFLEVYEGRAFADPGHREALYNRILEDVSPEVFVEMVKEASETFNNAVGVMVGEAVADLGTLGLFEKTPLTGVGLYKNYSTVLTFLFLRAVQAGKHPKYKAGDLPNDDSVHLARQMGFYAKQTQILIEKLASDLQDENFVFMGEGSPSEYFINDAKYQKFVAEGGTLNSVIGYAFKRNRREAPELLTVAVAPKYEAEFNAASDLWEHRRISLTGQQVETLVEEEIVAYIVETIGDSNSRMDKIREVRKFFKEQGNRMFKGMDIHDYIVRSVCLTLGKQIDAYFIHTEMNEFLTDNQDSTVSKAASYATTRLVSRWVARQYSVTEKNTGFATVEASDEAVVKAY